MLDLNTLRKVRWVIPQGMARGVRGEAGKEISDTNTREVHNSARGVNHSIRDRRRRASWAICKAGKRSKHRDVPKGPSAGTQVAAR